MMFVRRPTYLLFELLTSSKDELERLEAQHSVLQEVWGRIIFPSLGRPTRILDCGYGTGTWAVEVAEAFPECSVSAFNSKLPDWPKRRAPRLREIRMHSNYPSQFLDIEGAATIDSASCTDSNKVYAVDICDLMAPDPPENLFLQASTFSCMTSLKACHCCTSKCR